MKTIELLQTTKAPLDVVRVQAINFDYCEEQRRKDLVMCCAVDVSRLTKKACYVKRNVPPSEISENLSRWQILVEQTSQKVAGACESVPYKDTGWGEMANFVVAPEFRGSEVSQRVFDICTTSMAGFAKFAKVHNDNTKALRFFKRTQAQTVDNETWQQLGFHPLQVNNDKTIFVWDLQSQLISMPSTRTDNYAPGISYEAEMAQLRTIVDRRE